MLIGLSNLDSKTILSLHQSMLILYGGAPGSRDSQIKMMVGDVTRRFKNMFEQGTRPNDFYFDIAAAYFYGILKTTPFNGCNQRTALAIALYALEGVGAGMGTQYDEEELFTLVMDTVNGTKSEKDVANYFRANSDPVHLNGSYFYT